MSDYDETVEPDSDETLPPDGKDNRCTSPDLFEDSPVLYPKLDSDISTMKKQRSKTHEISDSDSEESISLTKQKTSKRKEDSKDTNGKHKAGSQDGKSKGSSKTASSKSSEKKKNREEFLSMTDSDSEGEYEKKKQKLLALKAKTKKKLETLQQPSRRERSKSPMLQKLQKEETEILPSGNTNNSAKRKKEPCQYGSECYRKNISHFEEFSHPGDDDLAPARKKQKKEASKVKEKSGSLLHAESATLKVKSEKSSASRSRSKSPLPSTSAARTHSPTADCRVVKKSGLIKTPKTVEERFEFGQPYSFFLTNVAGISDKYNAKFVMDIKDILSEEMGTLKASCQFNYMFDIQWLMKQYPAKFRKNPLLIVHGEHGSSMTALQAEAGSYDNIRFCQAKLEMMYGTHHTKMMLLLYEDGMRVVIHTSNLIEQDWHQKTQGMWISPLFRKLSKAGKDVGDSPTHFRRELIEYIQAYKAYQLKDWVDHISNHDMSTARVIIIGSVPGRHKDSAMSLWGHMKLRKCLTQHGPAQTTVKAWPVVGQFSSIGSMGPNKENWLCGEWLQSLSAAKSSGGLQPNVRLQLIFPSRDNVRLSLEGYPAGGSIPYSANTAKKQPFLHDFFHVWKAEGRGRSRAMPHIKTYARPMQDGSKTAWFLVTSANLSKAAWGALEKKGTQLMIRSYEIGVLFLPKFFDEGEIFPVTSDPDSAASTNQFLLPYDLPPTLYSKKDRPWMWDIPYMDLPDTNGNVWCPFSS